MTKIAQATDGNCTTRAISTMRLALGYKDALPSNWKFGGLWTSEFVSLLGDCFPNREVIVACPEKDVPQVVFTNSVRYVGAAMPYGDAPDDVSLDRYLSAFVYKSSDDRAHIVVGSPGGFGAGELLEGHEISLILAVSLEKNRKRLGVLVGRRVWAQFLKSLQRWSDFVCAKGLTKRCAGGIMTVEE